MLDIPGLAPMLDIEGLYPLLDIEGLDSLFIIGLQTYRQMLNNKDRLINPLWRPRHPNHYIARKAYLLAIGRAGPCPKVSRIGFSGKPLQRNDEMIH